MIQTLMVFGLLWVVGCKKDKGDNQPPECTITSPLKDAEFTTDKDIMVAVTAEDKDGSVAEVRLYVGNTEHGIKTTAPYNFTIGAGTLAAGTHTLKAVAKDDKGATKNATVQITVTKSNQPPTCTFTEPLNNAEFFINEAITVLVAATDADGIVTEVRLFVDNAEHGIKTTAPYSFTIEAATLAAGSHTLKAVSKDDKGATTEITVSVVIKPLTVGMSFQGGIIAYINETGLHGLIAATEDQSDYMIWNNYPKAGDLLTGASGTAIGTGKSNTDLIVAVQGAAQGPEYGYAALLCYDYETGGYSDWFLPSKDELNELYKNRVAIGGFDNDYYVSSSEVGKSGVWCQEFQNNGEQDAYTKTGYYRVRAVRYF